MQRSRLAWLPNALTIARLAALPVLLVVLIRAEGPTSVPAAVIFGVVAATDFLDGLLARRRAASAASPTRSPTGSWCWSGSSGSSCSTA